MFKWLNHKFFFKLSLSTQWIHSHLSPESKGWGNFRTEKSCNKQFACQIKYLHFGQTKVWSPNSEHPRQQPGIYLTLALVLIEQNILKLFSMESGSFSRMDWRIHLWTVLRSLPRTRCNVTSSRRVGVRPFLCTANRSQIPFSRLVWCNRPKIKEISFPKSPILHRFVSNGLPPRAQTEVLVWSPIGMKSPLLYICINVEALALGGDGQFLGFSI